MTAANRVFVDTNVLLYAIDSANPAKQARAAEWLDHLWSTGCCAISWQVLHEFYSNLTRKFSVAPSTARLHLRPFFTWSPVDTSIGLVERAWQWSDAAQLAYWDALILAAAERSGASHLLSEDFPTGRRFDSIVIVNPFSTPPAQLGLTRG